MLEHCDFRAETDVVFLTGSVVEGFSNSLSDLDVLVITDRPRAHVMKRLPGTVTWIDTVYIGRDEVAHHLATIPDIPEGYSAWGSAAPGSFAAVELLHDLCWGLQVSMPWMGALALDCDPLKSQLARSWALSNIISARARWHDAIGALQDGQDHQAAYLRGICLGHCVDAYTGWSGETDINPKWRWCKLARLAAEGRDILSLHQHRPWLPDGRFGSWRGVGDLLREVISLYVTGEKSGLVTTELETERLEIYDGVWVVVRADGCSVPLS
ncbi:MAG: nucleotidyltransferase domain-containing protein [Nitrospiraceae bacterium]|nr:nucleotidyltransferase domain-containing protein [Nitrospiraceae bacterium]